MQPTRYHLTLTIGLAAGLGATTSLLLNSPPAEGYPTSAISVGTNPVDAWAGTFTTTPVTVFSAPADQDIVVTDLHFSCNYACDQRVVLTRSDGTLVGSYWISGGYGSSLDGVSVQQSLTSGLPIPAGQSLSAVSTGSYTVSYTLSGYLSQP